MGERGTKTTLRFGAVSAPVSLLKTSGPARQARHEARRVLVSAEEVAAREVAAAEAAPVAVADALGGGHDFLPPTREPEPDGFDPELEAPFMSPTATASQQIHGDEHGPPPDRRAAEHFPAPPELPAEEDEPGFIDPDGMTVAQYTAALDAQDESTPAKRGVEFPPRPIRSAPVPYVPPMTRVEQGVHTDAGEWIDLTDRLAEIDRLTKVDGLEVVATISTTAIPRERVRDAHYIGGADPDTYKVLALLWRGLRATGRAAAVRWTKRTAQTLGLIVARGAVGGKTNPACLVLLEVEWAANMRKPAAKVTGPVLAEVEDDEIVAATELVEAFAEGVSSMNDLRDERNGARAELLALARAGRLEAYAPPAEPMPADIAGEAVDVAGALAASSAWLRDRVPA